MYINAAAYPGSGNLGKLYVKGDMFTAISSDIGWTVDDFFNRNKHFYFVEVGSSSFARRPIPIHARGPMDRNTIQITLWYRDPLKPRGPSDFTRPQDEAHGVTFNINQMVQDKMMLFLRGGLGTGGLAEINFTGGMGWRPESRIADLFGLGIGWSKPDDARIPAVLPFDLRDQVTSDVFYRPALTPDLAVIPHRIDENLSLSAERRKRDRAPAPGPNSMSLPHRGLVLPPSAGSSSTPR